MTDIGKAIGIGSRVVFTITEQTGEVFKIDEGGVHVFIQSRIDAGSKGYWPWRHVATRHPRLVRRYPRKLRHPRFAPSIHCQCNTKTGRGKVKVDLRRERVHCKKCRRVIGTESFPQRIAYASKAYLQAQIARNAKAKTTKTNIRSRKGHGREKSGKVRARIGRPNNRKASHRARKRHQAARSHSRRIRAATRKRNRSSKS